MLMLFLMAVFKMPQAKVCLTVLLLQGHVIQTEFCNNFKAFDISHNHHLGKGLRFRWGLKVLLLNFSQDLAFTCSADLNPKRQLFLVTHSSIAFFFKKKISDIKTLRPPSVYFGVDTCHRKPSAPYFLHALLLVFKKKSAIFLAW